MHNNKSIHLPIAVRAYPVSKKIKSNPSKKKRSMSPDAMFVFDTETRTDATQRLIFGSYRFIHNRECLEEGLFYADDISTSEIEVLEKYAFNHSARSIADGNPKLLLLTKDEFLEKLYRAAYKG